MKPIYIILIIAAILLLIHGYLRGWFSPKKTVIVEDPGINPPPGPAPQVADQRGGLFGFNNPSSSFSGGMGNMSGSRLSGAKNG